MNQLVLLLISFFYGLITGIIFKFLKMILDKKKMLFFSLTFVYFILISLTYIFLCYLLNKGEIHLYLKILLTIGFITSFKMTKMCKINKKSLI